MVNECHNYTNDVSKLDSFTSQISLKLKARGPSKRSLAIIVYGRRYTRELFCINMVMEVLDLGKQENTGVSEDTHSVYDIAEKSVKSKLPEKIERPQASDDESSSDSEEENEKKETNKPIPKSSHTVTKKPEPRIQEIKDTPSTVPSTTGLRKCTNSSCSNVESGQTKFEVCGYCKKKQITIPYCSRTCQQKDWPIHKSTCVGKN